MAKSNEARFPFAVRENSLKRVACLAFVLGAAGCGGPTGNSEAQTVQLALAKGGNARPLRRTLLGHFRPSTAQWTLEMAPPGSTSPPAAKTFVYGNPNDTPLVGDWNGDGVETQGVWRQGQWLLSNTLGNGTADVTFSFGGTTDLPVVGDWDGDGKATPGTYRNGVFSLRNSNSAGPADLTFGFGDPGNIPVVGDWNGDGIDTVGVYDPAHATFLLTNNPAGASIADVVVPLGDVGMRPVVGDWDADGKVTIGVTLGTQRFLLNFMEQSVADVYLNDSSAASTDIVIAGNWSSSAVRRPGATPSKLSSFFPLGVWAQYAVDFPTWRARGINMVAGVPTYALPPLYPNPETIDNWTNAANCVGQSGCTKLKMIRVPRATPSLDVGEANLLDWLIEDEPDTSGEAGAAHIATTYDALNSVQGHPPISVDLVGRFLFDPTGDICGGPGDYTNAVTTCYPTFLSKDDWIFHDFYPVNATGMPWGQNPYPLTDIRTVARTIDKVARWSSKPQFVFVEASPRIYDPSLPGPMPGQLRAEVWLAIIHGARGITYFTYSFCHTDDQGWCPDGVTPDVLVEMTAQNARITGLASMIQSPMNPSAIGFSVGRSAADWPIEATWRQFGGKTYVIVLNTSPNTLSRVPMTVTGLPAGQKTLNVVGENYLVGLLFAQSFTDSFQPYQVHIYATN
ncbi:MAG TPA: VCBS repeat-containing protein [Acidobacteriaceae bacterium]|nr:VCBS repeat-containing protein [Acidobacteriaceae bacterium]